jgi:hypothetical protein
VVIPADDPSPGRRASRRASDADREPFAQLLRDTTADGRLGVNEIDERLSATYAARTFGWVFGLMLALGLFVVVGLTRPEPHAEFARDLRDRLLR